MRQMRSISSSGAMRSWSSFSASRPNGRLHRLTRKPGPSTAMITCLPIASPAARARASAESEDCSPATTSSRRMTGGGLKKCMPTTRSGRLAPAAIAVTSSDEVLLARTHSSPTMPFDNRANSACLTSSRSGAASITSSHEARSSSAGAACSPSRAAAARESLSRPRSTPRSSWARIRSRPRSSASGIGSCSSVRAPDRHASWAIPAPIVPAPATPIVFGGSTATLTQVRARSHRSTRAR